MSVALRRDPWEPMQWAITLSAGGQAVAETCAAPCWSAGRMAAWIAEDPMVNGARAPYAGGTVRWLSAAVRYGLAGWLPLGQVGYGAAQEEVVLRVGAAGMRWPAPLPA